MFTWLKRLIFKPKYALMCKTDTDVWYLTKIGDGLYFSKDITLDDAYLFDSETSVTMTMRFIEGYPREPVQNGELFFVEVQG